jgi:hypothetical protein
LIHKSLLSAALKETAILFIYPVMSSLAKEGTSFAPTYLIKTISQNGCKVQPAGKKGPYPE